MIWDDPWIAAATSPGGACLPPVRPQLPTDCEFSCVRAEEFSDDELAAWADFVRTGWSATALRDVRLRGTHIALLKEGGRQRATCVLRRQEGGFWLLE
ncbi:hypothetical protein EBZ80_28030, partial [bacterium]|nr:hypothetical protein [bacterium]